MVAGRPQGQTLGNMESLTNMVAKGDTTSLIYELERIQKMNNLIAMKKEIGNLINALPKG